MIAAVMLLAFAQTAPQIVTTRPRGWADRAAVMIISNGPRTETIPYRNIEACYAARRSLLAPLAVPLAPGVEVSCQFQPRPARP